MTEDVWLEKEQPQPERMLGILEELFPPRRTKKQRNRKLRLFGCACCRRMWKLYVTPESREVIALAERYADGDIPLRRLRTAWERTSAPTWPPGEWTPIYGAYDYAYRALRRLSERDMDLMSALVQDLYGASVNDPDDPEEEEIHQADLLRDIFGNPFRPVTFDPAWRTEAAVGLALRMYDEREFAAMPILADALQEAGCEDADILTHCREPGTHVRGCWIVDLVLGKGCRG